MGQYGPPPENDYTILPEDVHEVLIVGVEEVPNTFYDPAEHPAHKAEQLQIDLKVREAGNEGVPLRMWSGAALLRDDRCKLTRLLRIVDPDFDVDKGYAGGFAEVKSKLMYSPIRVTTEPITKTKDGEERTYNKVVGYPLASKMGVLKDDAVVALKNELDATEVVEGEEIPF